MQLEVKRATRKTFGSIRTLCWTDHANLTRAQTSDIGMDPKLVRWVAEILMDGSEIRSLSGRSATLGDSFSRILRTRTKDLEGLTGQLRGFDLDQYLGEVLKVKAQFLGRSETMPCLNRRAFLLQ